MIPLWYTLLLMALTGAAGYLFSQLVPLTTTAYRLRVLRRSTRMVAEVRRIMAWTAPVEHWEAGVKDTWSLPVSPRLTDRDRIDAAKLAALAVPVALPAVRHAAPPPDIDWHRGEHRTFSWGWGVEVLARFASVGKTFAWNPDEHKPAERNPKHAAWNVDTAALQVFVAEATVAETTRKELEMDALLLALVAKGSVLR